MRADDRYIEMSLGIAHEAADSSRDAREAAARIIADAFAAGGLLHAFGTGHSHLLTLELFYRAGGFAAVDPVLVEELMLHESAALSTERERDPAMLGEVLDRVTFGPDDVLLVVSNSGGNAVVLGLAERAREAGVPVIALMSLRHARSSSARGSAGRRLDALADVILDNLGVEGDALVDVADVRVGPTSTVVGAMLLHAVMARVAELLAESGSPLEVFTSANLAAGDAENAALIAKYAGRVEAL